MKINKLTLILVLIVPSYCYSWSLTGPNNYDECIGEVIKNAKTDVTARMGRQNCSERFKKNGEVEECSATWNGTRFVRGYPKNKFLYKEINIENTTHRIFIPNMKTEDVDIFMNENIEKIKPVCPF